MKKLFILTAYLCSTLLYTGETIGILEPVSADNQKQFARSFYVEFNKFLLRSGVFTPVSEKKIRETQEQFKLLPVSEFDDYLFKLGLLSGSSKIIYIRTYYKNSKDHLYYKIIDCQKKEQLFSGTMPLSKPTSMINTVYSAIMNNYHSKNEYNQMLTHLRISTAEYELLTSLGGTIYGAYILKKESNITVAQYIYVLYMAGAASELLSVIRRNGNIPYYIQYLSYWYGIKLY
ncbi:hypothetical protein ACFL6D_01915 [Spirochaetota bacterium]